MTHSELIEVAVRWLRGTARCSVVLPEAQGGHEIPDAIGWSRSGRVSTLVECKTTRADFLRDRRKWHRRVGLAIGQQRYFLALPGIIKPEDLPDGWGLLEAHASGARRFVRVVVRLPRLTQINPDVTLREVPYLYAALVAAQSEPTAVCGISGGRALGKVRRPDRSWRQSCAACIRAKRPCPTGLSVSEPSPDTSSGIRP